ncbi:hypothetical protein Tco_1151960 [Tanacetum coccineum]
MYHPCMASPPYNPPFQSSLNQSFHLDDDLEPLWGIHEREMALCKAWIDVSENSVDGNARRTKRLRHKVYQFCAIYNSVKSRYKSDANESYYYDLAHKEYRALYGTTFTLVECWKLLKDHSK